MTTPQAPAGPGELLLVGRVVRAHGTGGELKVAPETDDPARLAALPTLYVGRSEQDAAPHAVQGVRFQQTKRGPLALVALKEVQDRGAAEALKKMRVFAAAADLPPLEEGEAFIHDLIGLRVESAEGESIGMVKGVLDVPSHALYVVARKNRPDALIPAVEAFVEEVDLDEGLLVVRPIEGLLD